MLNFGNMDSHEFESLCKDIMERRLGKKLQKFSRGRDGGIDICDTEHNPKIIIQAKHYFRSKYSDLKFKLVNVEKKHIENKNPESYYLCTTLDLTRANFDAIVNLFPNYMTDRSNILDFNELTSFLELEENKDLLTKYYSLWLCSSSILSHINNQNISIDGDELLFDIEDKASYFVRTEGFEKAKKLLDENKILIIVGDPGVGKSTISKMLLFYYANHDFSIRYSTDNNISNLKNSLSRDASKKEIILLDDFLGQHYLKMKESQPNEIKTLISFVKRNSNKKLILNSRITIVNEAKQSSLLFNSLMDTFQDSVYLIDLNSMCNYDKAKILQNHLLRNLSASYCDQIISNRAYWKIIFHPNYNPRIIEYVTRKDVCELTSSDDYLAYVLDKLSNPKDVWKDEFENRLDLEDRIFMNELYSLTDTSIKIDALKNAFNRRIVSEEYDTTINRFERTIGRLNKSLIRITEDGLISVINPSVNDFIKSELLANSNEQIKILDTAMYAEQIIKVTHAPEAIEILISKIISGDFLSLNVLSKSISFFYLQCVVIFSIKAPLGLNIKELLKSISNNLSGADFDEYFELVNGLFCDEFITYYGLDEIISDFKIMNSILDPLNINEIETILSKLVSSMEADEFNRIFRKIVVEKLTYEMIEYVENELPNIISNSSGEVDDYGDPHLFSIVSGDAQAIFEWIIESDVSDAYLRKNNLYSIFNLDFSDFDSEQMFNQIDIESEIKKHMDEIGYDGPYYEEYDPADRYDGISETNAINELFEK